MLQQRIFIHVEGGVVQGVYLDLASDGVEVLIIDEDTETVGPVYTGEREEMSRYLARLVEEFYSELEGDTQ